jgi:hypothetical protein
VVQVDYSHVLERAQRVDVADLVVGGIELGEFGEGGERGEVVDLVVVDIEGQESVE